MIYPIVVYGHPVLRKVAAEIDKDYPGLEQLISDLFETMYYSEGLGLAAPQIGKSLRLCVIRVDEKTYILINPRITYGSCKKDMDIEGCLSFPEKYIYVKRHEKVRVKALDEKGEEIILKAKGLLSRALQHEIDHLDGTVFTQREEKGKKIKK